LPGAISRRQFHVFRWLILIFVLLAAPAQAAVRLDFYARDTDARFPHAYVALSGTIESTGKVIDENYGFTPYVISPAVLFGRIDGHVISGGPGYVGQGELRFSLILTDEEYERVRAVVQDWQAFPQPSYDLDTRSCVTFIGAIAEAVGLTTPSGQALARRPASFLLAVAEMNAEALQARAPA
jgi:hypothetical protein